MVCTYTHKPVNQELHIFPTGNQEPPIFPDFPENRVVQKTRFFTL